MAEKATKAEANYRHGTEPKCCARCTMFRGPNKCTAVQGDISPTAVCDYFKRKS